MTVMQPTPRGKQTIFDTDATLADGARVTADYDNSTNLDTEAIFYLLVPYSGSTPLAGDIIASLYCLPDDEAGAYPEGSATIDPQSGLLIWTFESRNPQIGVAEVLATPELRIYGKGNRFVLRNDSGQVFDTTWQLDMYPQKWESV